MDNTETMATLEHTKHWTKVKHNKNNDTTQKHTKMSNTN
jgi:hypothetical protein